MKSPTTSQKSKQTSSSRGVDGRFGIGKSQSLYLVWTGSKSSRSFGQIWQSLRQARRLRSARQLVASFRVAEPRSIWLSSDASSLKALADEMPAARGEHRVLVFDEIADSTRQVLSAYFRHVLAARDSLFLLDPSEMIDVLTSEEKRDLFIGGTVDPKEGAVVLYRGNLDPLVVPLSWFTAGANSPIADESQFAVTDGGQTVRLGEFEAASDAILYEFDRGYRSRQRKQALATDDSFGASLRRLRLQKGLSREDFKGVDAKTIARIERNEVGKPRKETLRILAAQLGVAEEELGTY